MTDPIVATAAWLAGHVEWMRHRPEAAEFLADVEAAARVVRGLARGPAEQKYLGPCGAWVGAGDAALPLGNGRWEESGVVVACEGDVYAYRGAKVGRCKTCGAEVATAEREAWLDGQVREHVFRASEIAGAYDINVNTIRSWYARGLLANHGSDGEGRPLFNVGEVLDLAAADAARRETERAKRERRAATRAAESEDAA